MSKSRAELEAELKFLRQQRRTGDWASVVREAVRWGGAFGISYCFYLSVSSLAGDATTASIGISILGNFQLSDAFGVIFGCGGIGYGAAERRLRRANIKRMEERTRRLEKRLDPGRTSSGLTPTGQTHPLDR